MHVYSTFLCLTHPYNPVITLRFFLYFWTSKNRKQRRVPSNQHPWQHNDAIWQRQPLPFLFPSFCIKKRSTPSIISLFIPSWFRQGESYRKKASESGIKVVLLLFGSRKCERERGGWERQKKRWNGVDFLKGGHPQSKTEDEDRVFACFTCTKGRGASTLGRKKMRASFFILLSSSDDRWVEIILKRRIWQERTIRPDYLLPRRKKKKKKRPQSWSRGIRNKKKRVFCRSALLVFFPFFQISPHPVQFSLSTPLSYSTPQTKGRPTLPILAVPLIYVACTFFSLFWSLQHQVYFQYNFQSLPIYYLLHCSTIYRTKDERTTILFAALAVF